MFIKFSVEIEDGDHNANEIGIRYMNTGTLKMKH